MANPQVEDGFVRIAQEIMKALCRTRINGEARQVLDVIIHKTYGYNKKSDRISLSQFCEFTLLKKSTVCKAIKKLLSLNIITQKGNDIANEYRFNKDFDKWKPLPKKVTLPKKVITITQKGNASLPKKGTTKETTTKETTTKENSLSPVKTFDNESEPMALAKTLLEAIKTNKPDFKQPNLQSWAKEFDLILRLDKRQPEQIRKVIIFAQKDTFWRTNILSPGSLRKQFDRLEIKMNGGPHQKEEPGTKKPYPCGSINHPFCDVISNNPLCEHKNLKCCRDCPQQEKCKFICKTYFEKLQKKNLQPAETIETEDYNIFDFSPENAEKLKPEHTTEINSFVKTFGEEKEVPASLQNPPRITE